MSSDQDPSPDVEAGTTADDGPMSNVTAAADETSTTQKEQTQKEGEGVGIEITADLDKVDDPSSYQLVDLDDPNLPMDPNSLRSNNDDDGPAARQFPDAFYDPTTGEIMMEPVVNPAGDSYEKSTLDGSSITSYYPNRALQSIIQREVDLTEPSVMGRLRRADAALKAGWGRLMEKSVFGTEFRPLPEGFYCPITCDLMMDPVISKEGITYEREAIEQWIQANGKSPITRNPITVADLRENNALYELIQTEKGRTLESVHPSIRRWRESGAPTSRRPLPPSVSERVHQQQQPAPSAPPADWLPSHPLPQQPTVPGATTTTTNYPVNEAQLRAQQQERRCRIKCTVCLIIFTIVVLILNVGIGIAIIIMAFIFSMISLFQCEGPTTRHARLEHEREIRQRRRAAARQAEETRATNNVRRWQQTANNPSSVRGWEESVEEV